MTPRLRRAVCVGPRARTVSAITADHGDQRWPTADPDDAIAVGYLATYYQRTPWVRGHPDRTAANRMLRCLLGGAQHADAS